MNGEYFLIFYFFKKKIILNKSINLENLYA